MSALLGCWPTLVMTFMVHVHANPLLHTPSLAGLTKNLPRHSSAQDDTTIGSGDESDEGPATKRAKHMVNMEPCDLAEGSGMYNTPSV